MHTLSRKTLRGNNLEKKTRVSVGSVGIYDRDEKQQRPHLIRQNQLGKFYSVLKSVVTSENVTSEQE
jgi:hypothetical protein